MTLSSDPPAPLDWKFSQVFGERAPGDDLQDVDMISAIEFDKSGDFLAIGDRGGRCIIFERKDGKHTLNQHHSRHELEQMDFTSTQHPEFQFKTEFQGHEPEFDYLKSVEIEEKINKVRWCATSSGSQFMLSTNDKTIKLWKVKECKVKKVKEMNAHPFACLDNMLLAERSFVSREDKPAVANGYRQEWMEKIAKNASPSQDMHSKVADMEDTAHTRCRKVYAHAHDFNINSISNNSDCETFLSADDLRINLWNLEISDQCFNILDMKPPNMEDLTEVITTAEFHPIHCNLLAYSSSRGFIRLVDMRQSALCDHSARILQDGDSHGLKSFFTEIIASISDMKFSRDGRHILSRDYMNLKLWDTHMDSSPVAIYKIHEHLRPKLSELYNNDRIFDRFGCCFSGDGLHFATGSYSNLVRIFSGGDGSEEGATIEASKTPNSRKPLLRTAPRARRSSLSNLARGFYRHGHENSSSGSSESSYDLSSRLLHLAWHPETNLIASAAGNSLFMYYS
ncbi:serine/threonine protein phosphatase 2A 55 kDa regulatory subunit B beta isoform-like isoform X1 [Prunus yedoensis var. nudiflora]|uniref:Serine/threonine-protein phosphatase 2A 55 kDa regulatory subunit B n=1 Tax=Prunus yedoensis var. nudiflora TaxID=2094558 RepID=A0A314UYZ6_PRUYE|nr:serine/threonine protein phosphatase 2A 55 kDa regulatory subunit B beta isoform-like isoform X1 [Prunus yedoensis var. nudiflora]